MKKFFFLFSHGSEKFSLSNSQEENVVQKKDVVFTGLE